MSNPRDTWSDERLTYCAEACHGVEDPKAEIDNGRKAKLLLRALLNQGLISKAMTELVLSVIGKDGEK